MSSSIKEQFTICFPSLDRGFLKTRLFPVLDELANDKNLFDCNIVVLAQQFSSESIVLLDSIKPKLPNLKVVFGDGLINSFPMIRTVPASFADTEFVYVIDDDRHFRGDTNEFLLKIKLGIDLLNSSSIIKMVHFRSMRTPGVHLKFPHRVTEIKNLFRKSDINSGLFDEWINVRNLEDITLSPCLLDEGALTAIISLEKFKHICYNPESGSGDSFTSSTSAFGVPLRQRMNEYYIVMANFDDKVTNYRSLIDQLCNTESDVVDKFNMTIDRDGIDNMDGGAWTPKSYYPSKYQAIKDNPKWKTLLLDEFHKSLGLTGVPN